MQWYTVEKDELVGKYALLSGCPILPLSNTRLRQKPTSMHPLHETATSHNLTRSEELIHPPHLRASEPQDQTTKNHNDKVPNIVSGNYHQR